MSYAKRIKEVNARGLANGWHAWQLEKQAERTNQTMAGLFLEQIVNALAYSVPAELIQANTTRTVYKFKDNSTVTLGPLKPRKEN